MRLTQSSRSPTNSANSKPPVRRSYSSDHHSDSNHLGVKRPHANGKLSPIPGSPYVTDASAPPSPASKKPTPVNGHSAPKENGSPNGKSHLSANSSHADSISRARAKSSPYVAHRSPQPQSLNAAVEMLTSSQSESCHDSSAMRSYTSTSSSTDGHRRVTLIIPPATPTKGGKNSVPPSPSRPIPSVPNGKGWSGSRSTSAPTVAGKLISSPKINYSEYSYSWTRPVAQCRGVLISCDLANEPSEKPSDRGTDPSGAACTPCSSADPRCYVELWVRIHFSWSKRWLIVESYRTYPTLPKDLVDDIQHFSESDYARQYFSIHRTGFIFRRKVPVNQLMTWQKVSFFEHP